MKKIFTWTRSATYWNKTKTNSRTIQYQLNDTKTKSAAQLQAEIRVL